MLSHRVLLCLNDTNWKTGNNQMNKKMTAKSLIATAVLMAFNATAATSYFEARNDAMGGTGVASSHYSAAALANPALLTKERQMMISPSFCRPSVPRSLTRTIWKTVRMTLRMHGTVSTTA